jgi:hypothetical protein
MDGTRSHIARLTVRGLAKAYRRLIFGKNAQSNSADEAMTAVQDEYPARHLHPNVSGEEA